MDLDGLFFFFKILNASSDSFQNVSNGSFSYECLVCGYFPTTVGSQNLMGDGLWKAIMRWYLGIRQNILYTNNYVYLYTMDCLSYCCLFFRIYVSIHKTECYKLDIYRVFSDVILTEILIYGDITFFYVSRDVRY